MKLGCLYGGLAATLSCVIAGIAPYPAAAIMAGTGVGAVALHREVTGECWGACQVHWICNRDSGLCEPPPCGGECRIDEVCQQNRCIHPQKEEPVAGMIIDAAAASIDEAGAILEEEQRHE
jgi:hypothetical protein